MNKKHYFSHTISLAIPFHDVDSMKVVWHGNYFRYFENAREALLKELGFGYTQMSQSDYVWPIIDAKAKYIKPLVFEQAIVVEAYLTEFENRLRIDYEIRDAKTNIITTKAHTIQAAVKLETQELSFVTPDIIVNKIKAFLS